MFKRNAPHWRLEWKKRPLLLIVQAGSLSMASRSAVSEEGDSAFHASASGRSLSAYLFILMAILST